ncbi:S-formylglutathione hydrolase [Congregibacter brevis]|uniref:S-formylglutathione hydrolase n=1 Tax=Congregibacter brevis TaxID=3081201 RepID=A0ABZ0ID53_9GAMM|nr:S-formylglutathione hydrolase [Congregibacter sp. IMCC45268]
MEQAATALSFGGKQLRFKHHSTVLNCEMHFSLFLPPQATAGSVPLLTWLSGLTCTDENFVQKACAQRAAAEYGVAILAPDTSPRGECIADDPDGGWDLGLGAGFYVNATQAPWAEHYQMYDYVLEELPSLVAKEHSVDLSRQGIFGHSMGGHGALSIALKNPSRFRSVSAFAPICAPLHCSWGEKAFSAYLGADRSLWAQYDSCELIRRSTERLPLLVDQGSGDSFLETQLKTPLLASACKDSDYPSTIRMHDGYDHSYFFIASFMDEHIAFHAQHCAG